MKITKHPDADGLRAQLDEHDTWTVINALRTAAEVYDNDSKQAEDDRIKAQFAKQRDEARTMAEALEEHA